MKSHDTQYDANERIKQCQRVETKKSGLYEQLLIPKPRLLFFGLEFRGFLKALMILIEVPSCVCSKRADLLIFDVLCVAPLESSSCRITTDHHLSKALR